MPGAAKQWTHQRQIAAEDDGARPHAGQPADSGAAIEPHDQSLSLVVEMMGRRERA